MVENSSSDDEINFAEYTESSQPQLVQDLQEDDASEDVAEDVSLFH